MVMADEIAHQNIQYVVVDGDRFAGTWHNSTKPNCYTDKRTALSRGRGCSLLDANGEGLLR